MLTLLLGGYANVIFANDLYSTHLSVISTTQAYINQQTVYQQPQQNIVYHPTLGYMDYQQIWCNDAHQQQTINYQRFISKVCSKRGGELINHWCILSDSHLPLFYTFIAPYDADCNGESATIVHIMEMLPTGKKDPTVAVSWIKIAKSFGFN
ncbi:hypothetical protein [uncultured Photobacterium sp.]|uniref:hypothetical protein n=1 Tax=uncultured Photobacterium sp. TaxID=173973 RepID=UPI00260444F3|nr:hypothetical protein [uncultured Photobacterium sp.]